MVAHRRHFLRVERQHRLQAQDRVGEEHPNEAEHQHRDRVAFPIVLLFRIDAEEFVAQLFDRLENRIEKRLAVRVQHSNEIEPERLRDQKQQRCEVKSELDPA